MSSGAGDRLDAAASLMTLADEVIE